MSSADKRYYLTTPIYYVNFKPHVGTSYTTILADVATRHQRFLGMDAMFVTGSDEHSQNIADLAAAAGKTPLAYCDEVIPKFRECWQACRIDDYRFERTSDERHHALVRTFWQRIYDKGDVYKGQYSGWYHTSDNRFLDEDEVPENPESHPRLKFITEEAYYFKLSEYQDWLLKFHEACPEFIVPDFRRNEMLNRIEGGLKDICISRSGTDWGIRLPWDEGHVFYVWIEALLTYMTGSGFDINAFEKTFVDGKSSEVREPLWETTRADLATQPDTNYWPCDLHLMAKDIPWFHVVIWPAMLASYGAPLPKQALVHGYWNFDGEKMSKSLGNVVDPYDAIALVGVDGLRYFLMREVPLGLDGNFNYEALISRFNYDLANDLGNLVHRTVSMVHQNFEGRVPDVLAVTDLDEQIERQRRDTIESVLEKYQGLRYSEMLQELWALIGEANRYIDEKKPWELKKNPERRDEIATVFNRLVNLIRSVLLLAAPVIPEGASKFWQILNFVGDPATMSVGSLQQSVPAGHQLNPSEPVYRRLDLNKMKEESQAQAAAAEAAKPAEKPAAPAADADNESGANVITIDDFVKVQLRVAQVLKAEKVEKADKLLCLQLDDGMGGRQILAGIAEYYKPEDLVGRHVVIVANLAPRKLRGLMSEGMVLAASDSEGRLALISPAGEVSNGAEVR
ncbi:MAG: methionine--tRNA ligase subunit beta [Planctomycetales bacterium]|nr:methionine--tRNA ligase subunit beta [bacterium]UNM06912.1 MAG: methionine--tRNA ligase subunit beta [Planctomycetales bacterium]